MGNTKTGGIIAFTAGLSVIAGCFGGGEAGQAFVLDWGLVDVGAAQGAGNISCEDAGTPFVDLDVQNIQTKQVFHDRFDCGLGTAQSSQLPVGSYAVTARLRAAALAGQTDGTVISEITLDYSDVHRHGLTYLPGGGTAIAFAVQSFTLNWSLDRNGAAATCADVGAQTVELITQLGEDKPLTYSFPCAAPGRSVVTTGVQVGSYSIKVRLLDAQGNVLSTTNPMTFVVNGTVRADLPPVTFTVK